MLLEVEKINFSYGKTRVLWDISLTVAPAEIVIIAGSNGAGKSTLLKTVVGLCKPVSGTIKFDGERIHGMPPFDLVARGLTLIPEGNRVFPHLSVSDNLELGGYLVKSKESKEEVLREVYQLFPDLYKKRNEPARTLSGGQRQMLAIGMGMMSRPKLLLIDEPSCGLSPLMLQYLLAMIKKLSEKGLSILLVEQNIRSALKIADRGYVLENGKIILGGTGEFLKTNAYVRKAYLGM
ncbi:MAG: ABC transporter ATP-binding protein [Bacillota bacterium]